MPMFCIFFNRSIKSFCRMLFTREGKCKKPGKKKSLSILRLQSGGAESLHSVTLLIIEGVYTSMTEQQYTFYGLTHLDWGQFLISLGCSSA